MFCTRITSEQPEQVEAATDAKPYTSQCGSPMYQPVKVYSNKYSGQFKTFYNKEYKPKHSVHNSYFNVNTFLRKKSDSPMILHTIHKTDFLDFGPIKTDSCKKECKVPDALFMGQSSYQNTYLNWRNTKPYYVNELQDLVTSLPFKGNSSYRKAFIPIGLDCKNRPFPELKVHNSAIFNYTTTNQDMQSKLQSASVKYITLKEETRPSFSFPGQFLSEARKSFSGKWPSSPTASGKVKDHIIF